MKDWFILVLYTYCINWITKMNNNNTRILTVKPGTRLLDNKPKMILNNIFKQNNKSLVLQDCMKLS